MRSDKTQVPALHAPKERPWKMWHENRTLWAPKGSQQQPPPTPDSAVIVVSNGLFMAVRVPYH